MTKRNNQGILKEMIQTIVEEDIEVAVIIITTVQEEDPEDVLYVIRVITYALNVLLRTKLTSNSILNVDWVITL